MSAKPALWRFFFLASCFSVMILLFQTISFAEDLPYKSYTPILFTDGTSPPPPPASCNGQHGVLYEVWSNVGGSFVSDLTDDNNYPHNPVSSNILYNFEAPSDVADFYGARGRAYLLPPVSGMYTFWIASDDEGILFLSGSEDPIDMQIVARMPAWGLPHEWFLFDEQESAQIFLQAGQKYYIEVLHKEFSGGENLAVAWRRPDAGNNSPPQIITNPYLCAVTQVDSPPQAGFNANPYNGDAPLTVDFDASGSFDVDGTIVAYDWRFGDGGEATGEFATHTFTESGNQQVQLFVTDDDGNVSGSTIQYVTVFGGGFTKEDAVACLPGQLPQYSPVYCLVEN